MFDETLELAAEKFDKPVVKLIGEDGNAYNIIGKSLKALRKAGWDEKSIELFETEMTSGDYDHLLGTVMRYCEVS